MKAYSLRAWLLLLAIVAPLHADEPPGVWFLNAQGTGTDTGTGTGTGNRVYFSVGGTVDKPPQKANEVLLGWTWEENDSSVACYPGQRSVRYIPATGKDKAVSGWRLKKTRGKIPTLGVGPGWELFFLGRDSSSTQEAEAWAEVLDTIEAAYRHSSPNFVIDKRHGDLNIGILGKCRVMSRPIRSEEAGWEPRILDSRARSGQPGGGYHVARPQPNGRQASVRVQRFFRWIEDPEGDSDPRACIGKDPFLHLFDTPNQEGSYPYAYFLLLKNLDLEIVDMLDLEPAPKPDVRRLVDLTKTSRIGTINIKEWPAHVEEEDPDLCRAPLMDEICRVDASLRARLVTSVGVDGVRSVREGCQEKMKNLGIPADSCSDPDLWGSKIGIYLTDYRGKLPLVGEDLISEVGDSRVKWVWRGGPASGKVTAKLADGRPVDLVLPPDDPPDELLPQNPTPAHDASTDSASDLANVPPPTGEATLVPPPTGPTSPTGSTLPTSSAPSFLESLRGLLADDRVGATLRNPKLLMGISIGVLLFMGLIFFLRRSPDGPPARTSFVRRVSGLEEADAPVIEPEAETPMIQTELTPPVIEAEPMPAVIEPEPAPPVIEPVSAPAPVPEQAPAPEPAPVPEPAPEPSPEPPPPVLLQARPVAEAPPVEAREKSPDLPASPLSPLRAELKGLEPLERQALRQTVDATHRLANWISSALPVLKEIEEGHGLARFESLPLPSRREWIDAYDALRQFATIDAPFFEQLLPNPPSPNAGLPNAVLPSSEALADYLEQSGLSGDERPLRERLRRHLLAHDPPGRVHGVVLALQYLLEAFPIEHLDAANRKAYRAALRQKLLESGVPPQLHRVIGELAQGLGLRYQEVRYYKVKVGEPGFEFLENAHDRISLSARVGYEAGTEGRVIVRLTEIFLFESVSGAYYSGRGVIDEYAT